MTPARTLLDAIAALRQLSDLAKARPAADWTAHYDALGAASLAIHGLETMLADAAEPALATLLTPPDLSPAQLDALHDWLRRQTPCNVVPLRAPGVVV